MNFENFIAETFMPCVYILQLIGGAPGEFGFGYYLANLLIFVVSQPGLIILFCFFDEKKKQKTSCLNLHP